MYRHKRMKRKEKQMKSSTVFLVWLHWLISSSLYATIINLLTNANYEINMNYSFHARQIANRRISINKWTSKRVNYKMERQNCYIIICLFVLTQRFKMVTVYLWIRTNLHSFAWKWDRKIHRLSFLCSNKIMFIPSKSFRVNAIFRKIKKRPTTAKTAFERAWSCVFACNSLTIRSTYNLWIFFTRFIFRAECTAYVSVFVQSTTWLCIVFEFPPNDIYIYTYSKKIRKISIHKYDFTCICISLHSTVLEPQQYSFLFHIFLSIRLHIEMLEKSTKNK